MKKSSNNTDKLFELIKSLSKTEKRYFKLMVSPHKGEKSYLLLFNTISLQKRYNEEKLKADLSSKIAPESIRIYKKYLYDLIIKSLDSYHGKSAWPSKQCADILGAIEILYRRKLYSHCNALLKKAEKLASDAEDYPSLMKIMDWKRILMPYEPLRNNIESYMRLEKVLENLALTYTLFIKYNFRHIQLYFLSQKKFFHRGSGKSLSKIKEITSMLPPPGQIDKMPGGLQRAILECYSMYYQYTRNWKQLYIARKKLLEIERERYKVKMISQDTLSKSLYNFLVYAVYMNYFGEDFENALEEYALLMENDEKKKHTTLMFKLAKCTSLVLTDDAKVILIEYERVVRELQEQKEYENTGVYGLFFNIYFILGDYSQALIWVNKLMNESMKDSRIDRLGMGKLLLIVVHYEKQNMDMLESLIRSSERFMKKKGVFYEFERVFLSFFRRGLYIKGQTKENKGTFIELRKKLQKILTKSNDNFILEYFDFISWLESKIENRPFADVVKGKSERRGGS
ncbi:MAG: hypothetical protein HYU69_11705 [Bacteroidetes bacterium]|nr:hypothetical protein [Bacteroidota bacterium]